MWENKKGKLKFQPMLSDRYARFTFYNGYVEETGSQELVVSHRQKAQDYLNSLVPNIKTKDYKKNLFEEAYSGYKAGYNVNLSGKNLDKTKQKQLG